MEIRINQNYRITSDPMNIIVQERRITGEKSKNPGSETWINISYHNNIEKATHWLLDQHLRETDASDLLALVRELNTLKGDISKSLTAYEHS